MPTAVEPAIIHVAGPREEEWDIEGDPIWTQRCLRCDIELAASDRGSGSGWDTGTNVAFAPGGRVFFVPPDSEFAQDLETALCNAL